jgi:hypothetical protein
MQNMNTFLMKRQNDDDAWKLLSVSFYAVKTVHKFDFRLLIDEDALKKMATSGQ